MTFITIRQLVIGSSATLALLAALLMGSLASDVHAADGTAAGAFVRLERKDISGMTGRPVKIVELTSDGQILERDDAGAVRARVGLSRREFSAFETLIAQPGIQNATSECGRPMGADLPESELRVEYQRSTVTLRLAVHCSVPPIVQDLLAVLTTAERKYLPQWDE
jgi:hypothetical protein